MASFRKVYVKECTLAMSPQSRARVWGPGAQHSSTLVLPCLLENTNFHTWERALEHYWWERDDELMVKYESLWFVRQKGCVSQTLGICAGHSRYLRQPGKICSMFVPAGAVVRFCPPRVIWVTAQVVWVAFVCLVIGVET